MFVEAQYYFARMYAHGGGVKVDKRKASYWYTKAAEQGLGYAQYDLALMYDNGDGIEVDKEKALYWYKKAADQGVTEARLD